MPPAGFEPAIASSERTQTHALDRAAAGFLTGLYTILTPWSRVLEKLIGSQLVQKFLAFYGTGRFITAFTSAR
jgi:hypothetical protein